MVLLLEERRYASAMALLRPALESFLRGEWLAHCASEAQVDSFMSDEDPPKLRLLLDALEQVHPYEGGKLTALVRRHWDAMCSFTHTGGLHVQRWMTETAVEPAYTAEELLAALRLGELVGSLATVATAALAGRDDLGSLILGRWQSHQNAA
ncbi:hypothetical protein LRS07_19605 [Aquabacterium sp. J223]|nr:hypothetical protein [Aquabacterium sp. J223]UUX95390.1 hypothetical protein LRS07_19605 [Aquabacterium sp. J223]